MSSTRRLAGSAISAFRAGTRQELTPSPFPDGAAPPSGGRRMSRQIDLERDEGEAGLPLTPPPDPSLLTPLSGGPAAHLADTLAGHRTLGPGDLAREARQVLELLEQIAAVAPAPVADAGRGGRHRRLAGRRRCHGPPGGPGGRVPPAVLGSLASVPCSPGWTSK